MSQTVHRALEVLAALAAEPLSVEQLAERLGVHRTTALRTLQVLDRERMVVRDERKFRLGSRLFALANEALESLDLRRIASPYLSALNDEPGHALHSRLTR